MYLISGRSEFIVIVKGRTMREVADFVGRRIAPAFDKVGEQFADTLIAGKINYDEEPQLIQRFGIDTIPTLMLFKDGEALGSKAAIEAFIKETLEQ